MNYLFFLSSLTYSIAENISFTDDNSSIQDINISYYYGDFDDHYNMRYIKRNETTNEIICGANATAVDNDCVCLPGYSGNPYTGGECYKCLENCSQYAYCVSPGVCECHSEYEGNGTYCELTKPMIHSMTKVNKTLVVGISFPSDSDITKGFCMFDGNIVEAQIATKLQFICPIPPNIKEQTILQISINGKTWTSSNMIFEDHSQMQKPPSIKSRNIVVIIFILSMIGLTLLLANSKPVSNDEVVPFIKEKPRTGLGILKTVTKSSPNALV